MEDKLDFLQKESEIVQVLKQIYDPEIPINVYDLGLIYEINIDEEGVAEIKMTLTAPNCPIADDILTDIRDRVGEIEGVKMVNINLVFDPPWDKNMMTEEAQLELGLL